MLNKTSMKYESNSTKNGEITTSKITYDPNSTKNMEITATEMISKPHSTQKWEITTTKIISRSSGKLFFCFDIEDFLSIYLFSCAHHFPKMYC